MNHTEVMLSIVECIGGEDNLRTIKRNKEEITVIVYDNRKINIESLRNIHKHLGVQVIQNRVLLSLRKRDVRYLFDAFKVLPTVEVIRKDNPQEDEAQSLNPFKNYYKMIRKAPYGHFAPYAFALVGIGYAVGILNFLAHIL